MEEADYTMVLEALKSPTNKRDPHKIRLAAVAAAISDVVGTAHISAAKVYAATVSSLEGTLKGNTVEDAPHEILDSLMTQSALLELLRVTLEHIENPAILDASLPLSSRVLRGVVDSLLAMESSDLQPLDTKDGLGGTNSVLRGVCRASTELMKNLTRNCDAKLLKQCFFGTLMALFDDNRPKVRKASHNSIIEIVLLENCNPEITKAVSALSRNKIRAALKKASKEGPQPDLLHLLGFLDKCINKLDTKALGGDIMELLAALLKQGTANAESEFVTMARSDSSSRILTINALLTTAKEIVESESSPGKKGDGLASRILATLLQNKPNVIFVEGSADLDLLHNGRNLYGSVIMCACRRVIEVDPQVACKLFPVSIQVLLKLCQSGDEEVDEQVAEAVFTEMSALLRSHFQRLVFSPSSKVEDTEVCITQSLQAMEFVLLPQFENTWTFSLKPLAIMMQFAQENARVIENVSALIKLRTEAKGDTNSQRALEAALGSLVEGVGIEVFWNWVDWEGAISKSRGSAAVNSCLLWLLPVMKASALSAVGKRPHLKFFQERVLSLARRCATKVGEYSRKLNYDDVVIHLWGLFVCFCQHPVDTQDHLEILVPTLVKAMEDTRFPQLLGIICSGLEALSLSVKESVAMDEGIISDEKKGESDALAKASVMLLPALFKNVERLHASTKAGDDAELTEDMEVERETPEQSLVDSNLIQKTTQAVASLGSHAPTEFLQKMFKKLMRRLLEEGQHDHPDPGKLCALLNLAQALVASGSLEQSGVGLLYRTVKPLARNDRHENKVHKMSYRVLGEICRHYHSVVSEAGTLKELIDFLTGTAITSHTSSRPMRLKCIGILVDGFGPSDLTDVDVVTRLTGELLLCLKDSKAKTRDNAYQVLISLAKATGDLVGYLRIVTAALASETSHMRSAAVSASSRLVFQFARADLSLQEALPSLLQTVLLLFNEQSREVIKSAVGFVRVCVAAMPKEHLQPMLPDVVGALLKYHKVKDRFRPKIKIILKKLVKLYGYDTLMPFVPKSETRLLVHMRKLEERAARRKAADRAEGAPETQDYDEMVGSDEYDSDDGRTLMTGASGLTRKTKMSVVSAKSAGGKSRASSVHTSATKASAEARRLPSEKEGEVLNILSVKEKNVRFADSDDSDSDDDGVMEFDDFGRLVVTDEADVMNKNDVVGDLDETSLTRSKRRKLGSDCASVKTTDSKKKGKGSKVRQLGAAYKSKKAGGDVKKKGQKFEPYAYVPLDGRSYSKKNRRRAVEQMASVVPQGGKRKRK